MDMQFEVEFCERELADEGGRAEIIPRRDHLVKQSVRYRLAGLMMAGEQIESLPVPAEVLHDL